VTSYSQGERSVGGLPKRSLDVVGLPRVVYLEIDISVASHHGLLEEKVP
jgi:hypothetical protein